MESGERGSDAIIRLNVGGTLFETTESTLKFDGCENFLTALVSGRTPSLLDASGAYFIDRDPDYFSVILRFLRTRRFDPGSCGASLPALHSEALFYSLDTLADVIQNKITNPSLAAPGDVVGPRLDGAYVNAGNTKAIVFQCCGADENENKILLVEAKESEASRVDAFAQARVAHAAYRMPSLWDENNKVDYAAFFYKYIKRGKFLQRSENGTTFLSLIVPGQDQLIEKKMGVLAGRELMVFTSAEQGSFVKFDFHSFNENASS